MFRRSVERIQLYSTSSPTLYDPSIVCIGRRGYVFSQFSYIKVLGGLCMMAHTYMSKIRMAHVVSVDLVLTCPIMGDIHILIQHFSLLSKAPSRKKYMETSVDSKGIWYRNRIKSRFIKVRMQHQPLL